jgi:hypothetical protein
VHGVVGLNPEVDGKDIFQAETAYQFLRDGASPSPP